MQRILNNTIEINFVEASKWLTFISVEMICHVKDSFTLLTLASVFG